MNDMSATIVAKSDQINAADLIGTTRTVIVREVRIKAGDDQPVTIMIEGDKKAFRPCKGVRRLLVRVWGADANKYIGQSMTLYCDPTVTWAGKEEGGIRVSHMTGLDEEIIEYMRTSREKTKPYKILPLVAGQTAVKTEDLGAWANKFINSVGRAPDLAKLNEYAESVKGKLDALSAAIPEAHEACMSTLAAKRASFAADDDEPFATDQPTDHTGFVTGIERRIADASDLDTLDAVQADLNSNSDNLPDDVTAGLDAKIAARKRALSKAQGGEGK